MMAFDTGKSIDERPPLTASTKRERSPDRFLFLLFLYFHFFLIFSSTLGLILIF
jgi:hypothetical protein